MGKYYEANRRLVPDEILKINGSTEPAVRAAAQAAFFVHKQEVAPFLLQGIDFLPFRE